MSVYKDKTTNNWVLSLRYHDIDNNAKRKTKRGFKTKRAALEWKRKFLASIDEVDNLKLTLDEFFDIYIRDIETRLRDTTLKTKQFIYKKHIGPYFNNMQIKQIKSSFIIGWQNQLNKQNLKPTYLRSIDTQLRSIFNHASRFYGLKSNPMTIVPRLGNETPSTMNYWTKEEFDRFISVIDDEVIQLHFYILFYTGVRLGEFLAIRLKNLDFNLKHIEINESARYENKEYIFSKPKTPKSKRIVTIPNFLVQRIKIYIDRFYFIDEEEQLFQTTPSRLTRAIEKYTAIAKIKKIRIHDLRHSHASLLINQGVQPNIVQERLGHEKIETTLRTYSHMYPNKQYELAEYLNKIALDEKTEEMESSPLIISTVR